MSYWRFSGFFSTCIGMCFCGHHYCCSCDWQLFVGQSLWWYYQRNTFQTLNSDSHFEQHCDCLCLYSMLHSISRPIFYKAWRWTKIINNKSRYNWFMNKSINLLPHVHFHWSLQIAIQDHVWKQILPIFLRSSGPFC